MIEGKFFQSLSATLNLNESTKDRVKATVEELQQRATSLAHPGMLLGKIQSGKTRAFFGVIALAFDNDFEVAIVLTKGTKALAKQTYERFRRDYASQINNDEIQIFDVMGIPDRLTDFELGQKIVFVCKKEDDNLRHLKEVLQKYSALLNRKTLMVDDEADFASVGFHMNKTEGLKANQLFNQINEIRGILRNGSLLQVTATPYSLYLQPNGTIEAANGIFKPVRPAFTVVLPEHEQYIGGDFYFRDSLNTGSVASYLLKLVDPDELEILTKSDRRTFRIEECLTHSAIKTLRLAVVTFVVGGTLRRLQSKAANVPAEKYSFIIHTESSKGSHSWQEDIVVSLIDELRKEAAANSSLFRKLVTTSYEDIAQSVQAGGFPCPTVDDVIREAANLLSSVMATKVNSEPAIETLLDESGELKLRTPLNIFIGGQILDRGITIKNLIGFYYGRRPKRFQQDTVLQHSRMYGARSPKDLAVTRFYTTSAIYDVMKTIHEFDSALRDAFLNGGNEKGVIFVRREAGTRIVPCSPNKILMSDTITLTPLKRIAPSGFQTGYKSYVQKIVQDLDALIASLYVGQDENKPISVDEVHAEKIIDLISGTLDQGILGNFDKETYKAILNYVSNRTESQRVKSKVILLVRRGRKNARVRASGRFENSPDTVHIEGEVAKKEAIHCPMLMLFRQEGTKEQGWRDAEFWWPVIYMPGAFKTVVFATDVQELGGSLNEFSPGPNNPGPGRS